MGCDLFVENAKRRTPQEAPSNGLFAAPSQKVKQMQAIRDG